jgi:hypothetical protein
MSNKWGGNFNCIYCLQYLKDSNGQHKCVKYKTRLRKGNVPGVWILPCNLCHEEKNYGNKKAEEN